MRRVVVVGLLGPLLNACAPSVAEERELGAAHARQVEGQLRMSTDTALDAFIDSLGGAIAAVADTVTREWRFSVVDDDAMNAFALPGGFIYLNRGLVARAGSMAELAGVLGHEIGHVVLRHSSRQVASRGRANIAVSLFCSITGWCSSEVAQVAINVGGAALFARHSRADESEADSVSLEYLYRAGIDPRGVSAMFARIARERTEHPDLVTAFFASHPLDGERIERSRRQAARWPAAELDELRRDEAAFALVRPLP